MVLGGATAATAVALVVFLIACATIAQENAPSNQPKNPPEQQQSAPDNRGTDQVPFVVKEVPRERTTEERQEAAEKTELDRKLAGYTSDLAAYTKLLFIATFVLALVTSALAIAAFLQIREGRRGIKAAEDAAKAASASAKAAADHAGHAEQAIKVTEDTAERQLRAYVWVKATELHDLQVSALPRIKIEVRNAGQTPAYDLLISAGCLAEPYPLPENHPFPTIRHRRATRMVLHPGTEPPFEAFADTKDSMNLPNGLDQRQVQALIRGDQMRLFAFVLVTYRDAFKKDRETYFCASADATAALTGISPYPVSFEHCDQHNSAT